GRAPVTESAAYTSPSADTASAEIWLKYAPMAGPPSPSPRATLRRSSVPATASMRKRWTGRAEAVVDPDERGLAASVGDAETIGLRDGGGCAVVHAESTTTQMEPRTIRMKGASRTLTERASE